MGNVKVYGVMTDTEGVVKDKDDRSRIEFDIAKFDSDPWATRGMKWDSDNLNEGTVGYLIKNIEDSKIMTIQLKTTGDPRPNAVLRRAKNMKGNGWKAVEGVLDFFQLNIKFDGSNRRSIRFAKPTVELFQPHKENNINYLIFTVKTTETPNANPSEL